MKHSAMRHPSSKLKILAKIWRPELEQERYRLALFVVPMQGWDGQQIWGGLNS